MNYFKSILILLSLLMQNLNNAQESPIIINADKLTAEIQPTMWGIFFEDINFGADGGLYAELIKNGSFEFSEPMMGWKEVKESAATGKTLIINRQRGDLVNPRFLRISNGINGSFGIENEGFRGIGVKKNGVLNLSIRARRCAGSDLNARAEILDGKGRILAREVLPDLKEEWTSISIILIPAETNAACSLRLMFSGAGIVDIDRISLFPSDTWKNRPKGLRGDLVKMLEDLKPGFIRFPGGCIVEGYDLSTRYQWKNSVGPVEKRKLQINRWNNAFKHRPAPDYFQSFGLGFYEFFLLAEDLNAEPVPILNCGMACQFNTAEVASDDQLEEYITDAIDLIEFANGGTDTKWGGLRSSMGHPLPFNMKYLGIGNEQWGEQYINILEQFKKVLNTKYPEIMLIASSSASSSGEEFDYLWKHHRRLNINIVDEHYYGDPAWFLNNAERYDDYDRKGPRVFAGEYAAQSVNVCSPDNKNTWLCALSEAAFMTGLERNADVVQMASYAPLLAHNDAWQWKPDLIYFDNLNCFGSANYYVQKLFSTNKGTHAVSITRNGLPLSGQDSIYSSACINKEENELIIKIVNASQEPVSEVIKINGARCKKTAKAIVLSCKDLNACNTMEHPERIIPIDKKINIDTNSINFILEEYSLSVLKVEME